MITGPDPDGGTATPGIRNLEEIRVQPGDISLSAGDRVQEQVFTATGIFRDGHSEDITARVLWTSVPPLLGRFKDVSTFTSSGYGGEGKVFARSGTLEGSAVIRVRVSRTLVEDDAKGADASKFAGANDPALAPTVVYPYSGALLPPNLSQIEIHFLRGAASNNLFEITLQNKYTNLTVYSGCRTPPAPGDQNGCVYALTPSFWETLAYSNLGGAEPVRVAVRATNAQTPTKSGASAAINLRFAPDDLRGGIYYWTAEGGDVANRGIHRIDLVQRTSSPFYLVKDAPADNRGGKNCLGCHAISHDGKRMTSVLGGGHISDLLMLNVEKPSVPFFSRIDTNARRTLVERQFSNFQTFGPDGTSFVSALRGTLSLLQSDDGAPIRGSLSTGGLATQPHWSRNGTYLTYTRYFDSVPAPPTDDGDNYEFFVKRGSVALMRWDAAQKNFVEPKTLVALKAGQNSYYPAVAPDEKTVVFNRVSGCSNDEQCTSYHNPRARLFITDVAGQGEQELINVNKPGATDLDAQGKTRDQLTNSWPKWSPFRQQLPEGRTLLWVTFSFTRSYGVRSARPSALPQLWMAAVIVGGEPTGQDPSLPPFWIPYQNLKTDNHIAQWTEEVRQPLP